MTKVSAVELAKALTTQYTTTLARKNKDRAMGFEETLNTKLVQRVERYYTDAEEIRSSRDYTPEKKTKDLLKNATAFLEDLKQFESSTADVLDTRSKTIEATLFKKAAFKKPSDPAERISLEMRQREVRDELRNLGSQTEIIGAYLSATDDEVIDAFESAPPRLTKADKNSIPVLAPFLDPERVNAARIERARRIDPAQAGELDDFREMEGMFRAATNMVRQAVIEEVPGLQGPGAIDHSR